MRKGGGGGNKGGVTAYPRQLESLIRLSEAHAKTRLSNRVEKDDVREALRLYREALKQSATDPRTGIVDISILTTGNILRVVNRKPGRIELGEKKRFSLMFAQCPNPILVTVVDNLNIYPHLSVQNPTLQCVITSSQSGHRKKFIILAICHMLNRGCWVCQPVFA